MLERESRLDTRYQSAGSLADRSAIRQPSQESMAGEPVKDELSAAVAGARRYQQNLQHYRQKLEQRRQVALLLQANRRFKEIEGKHLALVISVNLFVAVIPLLIIIYAFAEAFSPHRRSHPIGIMRPAVSARFNGTANEQTVNVGRRPARAHRRWR